jgi:hypothetical protein
MIAWRAVGRDDVGPALLDFRERRVPGDPLVCAAALRTDALHRVEQPIGIVMMLGEAVELDAEAAARHRVLGIAGHVDQLAVLDVVEESASVGAIVRTCTSHDAIASVYGHCGLLCIDRASKRSPSGTIARSAVRVPNRSLIATRDVSARVDDSFVPMREGCAVGSWECPPGRAFGSPDHH